MRRTLLLDDIDAAGVAFGPRLIALAHQAVEPRLDGTPLAFAALLREGRWVLPIVAIAADFRRPLRHGDAVTFQVALEELGRRSVRLGISLRTADGSDAAHIRQTHACLDRSTGQSCDWPAPLAEALRALAAG